MVENREIMDRRIFLKKSASFLFGSLLGFHNFSNSLAFGAQGNSPFFQPRIALIIDDIGYSRSRARQFLKLGIPMTFAILPRLAYSYDLSYEIRDKGHEIMLHQPMEPYDSKIDPGPGALYVGDGPERIVRIIEENISYVPYSIGVNNHMGSRFTASQNEINRALRVIKERDLFFIDSLTTNRSMAYKTARRLHMATACRNIFLDNRPYKSCILSQLNRLKAHARKYGRAIGIGHPYPETVDILGRFLRNIKDSGYSFVHVSRLLNH